MTWGEGESDWGGGVLGEYRSINSGGGGGWRDNGGGGECKGGEYNGECNGDVAVDVACDVACDLIAASCSRSYTVSNNK